MSLTAKRPENEGDFDPVEAGTHHAVCYSVVDIGTQYSERFDTFHRQVVITWEIPSLRIEIDGEDLPRALSKTYTLSLSEKSNLYNDLLSWRGVAFTEQELEGFDVRAVVGANCLLNVVHKKREGKKPAARIQAVIHLPKGSRKLEPENPTVTYSIEDDGFEIPGKIPGWIQDWIKKSKEWKGRENAADSDALRRAQERAEQSYQADVVEEESLPPF